MVYGDLKPENIMIDAEGYLRLIDFGLARRLYLNSDGDMVKTSETFGGTLEYMAPEIMQEKPCGASVDWFSFGILLFELLSGKNPFKNSD